MRHILPSDIGKRLLVKIYFQGKMEEIRPLEIIQNEDDPTRGAVRISGRVVIDGLIQYADVWHPLNVIWVMRELPGMITQDEIIRTIQDILDNPPDEPVEEAEDKDLSQAEVISDFISSIVNGRGHSWITKYKLSHPKPDFSDN